jgi:hypothetical protein
LAASLKRSPDTNLLNHTTTHSSLRILDAGEKSDEPHKKLRAAEAVGLDAHTVVRMLDRGITLEGLLEFIESQLEYLRSASQPPSERDRAA